MVSFVSLEAFVLVMSSAEEGGARGTLQQQAELWCGGRRETLQARPLALSKSTFLTGKDPRKHKVRSLGSHALQHPQHPGDTKDHLLSRSLVLGPDDLQVYLLAPSPSVTTDEEFRVGIAVTRRPSPSQFPGLCAWTPMHISACV